MSRAHFLPAIPVASLVLQCVACSGATQGSAQGPSLSFDHSLGEGKRDEESEPRSPRTKSAAKTAPADSAVRRKSDVPDPEPLKLDTQWEYQLAYDAGKVRVKSVDKKKFEEPMLTARRYGRFAIELWIGRELVDRVRFDFPLVHPEPHDEAPGSSGSPISLSAKAHSEQTVLVPASPRATRAVLVDSSNGQVDELQWPPDRPMGPNDPAD